MTDPNLESRLTDFLAVDDAMLERIAQRVTRARPGLNRTRWFTAAAAAGLAAVAAWWWGDAAGGPEPWTLVMRRDLATDGAAHYEPPSFGDAVARSDWLLLGRVAAVTPDEVRFEVRDVLLGDRPSEPVVLSRTFDRLLVSCRLDLTWTHGEDLALGLFRDPEDGAVKVTEGGSGQGRFPLGGVAELGDLRVALATGTLPPNVVAERVARHGPGAISVLRRELGALLREPLGVEAPIVQRALEPWAIEAASDAESVARRRRALRLLEPARVRDLPQPRLDALVDEALAAVATESSPHARKDLLRPFAMAGVPAVRPALRSLIDEVEAGAAERPQAYGFRILLLELYEQLHELEPGAAVAAAWSLYAASPPRGEADAGDVLRALVAWDPERAVAELLARSAAAHAAGDPVWLDILIRRPEPEARAMLRRVLADPDYSLGANRYDHDPARALRESGVEAHLDDVRDVLVERLRDEDLSTSRCHDWLALYLLGFDDLTPFADALAAQLERLDDTGHDSMQLARAVDEALRSDAFPYRHPTVDEMRAAVRVMAARLRR